MDEKVVALAKAARQIDSETWEVPSNTVLDKVYTVKWWGSGGSCTCTGYRFRYWCAHVAAAKLLAEETTYGI